MSATPLSQTMKAACGSGFGFVTGWTDVMCLIRFSAFGTMMTGNLLMIARKLVEPETAEAGYIPTSLFFALIIVFRCLGLFLHHICIPVKCGAACLLAPLTVAAMAASEGLSYMDMLPFSEKWNVCLVSMIFGIQSAATFPTIGVPTLLATGHMTNIFYVVMSWSLGEPDAALSKAFIPACVVLGMMLGAVAGAFAMKTLEGTDLFDFMLTPVIAIQGMLLLLTEYLARRREDAADSGAPAARTAQRKTLMSLVTDGYTGQSHAPEPPNSPAYRSLVPEPPELKESPKEKLIGA